MKEKEWGGVVAKGKNIYRVALVMDKEKVSKLLEEAVIQKIVRDSQK